MNQVVKHRLSRNLIAQVASRYGYELHDYGAVEGGYRNTSYSFTTTNKKTLNFIVYKDEPGILEIIRRVNTLGAFFAKHNLPVRQAVDERIVQLNRRYGSLYTYVPGNTIAWEAYSMKHIKLLGWVLGCLHTAGRDFDGELPNITRVCLSHHARLSEYFERPEVKQALQVKLGMKVKVPGAKGLFPNRTTTSDETVLHMDLVRGNVLFRAAIPTDTFVVGSVALSGVLDLEKAAVGPPVYDVARSLAFLLVDCPKPTEKLYKYFLTSGYRKRGHGAALMSRELEQLITFFLVYDLYKFLRQNPYESLAHNHHFQRTLDILVRRKVVQLRD